MMLKEKSNPLRLFKYLYVFAAALFLGSCGEKKVTQGDLEVIPVGMALDQQTNLKVSDCFKKVRYVPLETTDSCLVGRNPVVLLLKDWILVKSDKRCHLFEKETGRFVRTIGHVGNDPEGYSDVYGGWINSFSEKLYFPGWHKKKVVYGVDGKFEEIWESPIAIGDFPQIAEFCSLGTDITVGYYSATDSLPARVALFQDKELIKLDSVNVGRRENIKINSSDVASISVFQQGESGIVIVQNKSGQVVAWPIGSSYFWNTGQNVCFKQPYNDTIYQVSREKGLEPIRVLDLGTHGWTFEERLVDKKDAIYPLAFMENQEVILFRFVTNLYNKKRKNYNALYRKSDGRVLVSPFDNKIIDDKNGFLPLQPLSVSVKGEFAALLPAEDVFNWFEGNGVDATLPAEIAALKKVGEEDNPVVAIME